MTFFSLLINWGQTLLIGIPSLIIIYLLAGKKPISKSKVKEREFLIRSNSVSQSWIALMITMIFGTFYDFYNGTNVEILKYSSLMYLLTGIIVYAISYILNRRRFI
ncbi:hypothetical protein [Paraclostridium tenue]|uniref:DUF3784 domain-containing protein n=1 Tax=Paraclostridium tenue TaxID=1737 RepID=A0ABP3XGK7_9FIRM